MVRLESFRTNTVDARSVYVAISRAKIEASVYPDSREKLAGAIEQRMGERSIALASGRNPASEKGPVRPLRCRWGKAASDPFCAIHEGVTLRGKRTFSNRKLYDSLFLNGGAALGALLNMSRMSTSCERGIIGYRKKRDITNIVPNTLF